MADPLYSGIRTTETILGGLFGAGMYGFLDEGVPGPQALGSIVLLTVVAIVLQFSLHYWYEVNRGERYV